MYPQQPQQPPFQSPEGTSLDYLDSISVPTQQKMLNPFILWGFIGGGMLLLVLMGFWLFGQQGPSTSEQFTTYYNRLTAIETTAKSNSKIIRNSNLRSTNGSMLAILGTAKQESSTVLSGAGLEKLPANSKTSAVAVEFSSLAQTLDDARLNVQFDRTYAREIAYQLSKLRAEMTALYQQSNSRSLKEYLEKTDQNIEPIVDQFNTFNNSAS